MTKKKIFLSPPHLTGKELENIKDALNSGWIAPLGPHVDSFEKEMSNYIKTTGAVAMQSGTSALYIALSLLGVKDGDHVFCSSLTFIASATPIMYHRATPTFIDSEPNTWNMSPKALEEGLAVAKKENNLPKAVITVDLFGMSADYDKILDICNHYDVPVIEDAAEALGSKYKEKMCGSFGALSILSFNGNKIITTSGGGMLLSNNEKMLKQASFLITQARDPALHYQHSVLGHNYRMSNILAAIGRAQLDAIEKRVLKKREIFNRYQEVLNGYEQIEFMKEPKNYYSNRWLSTFTLNESCGFEHEKLILKMHKDEIDARPVWKPLHMQPLFNKEKFISHDKHKGYNSVSEFLFKKGICLPSGTAMSDNDFHRIISSLKGTLNK